MLGLAPSTRLRRRTSCTAGTGTNVSYSTETGTSAFAQQVDTAATSQRNDITDLQSPNNHTLLTTRTEAGTNRLSQRHESVRPLPNTGATVLQSPNVSALRMDNDTRIYGLEAESFDPPPPYEIQAAPVAPAQRDVQLPRRPDTRVQPLTRLAQPPIKVAMLPFHGVTEGSSYMKTAMPNHSVQDSPTPGCGILYCLYKSFYCVRRTERASQESKYTDESHETLVFSRLDEVGPGEVERPIQYQCYDWTLDWDVHLIVQAVGYDDYGSWVTGAYLFFSSLSGLGVGPIPWHDAAKTRRLEVDRFPVKNNDKTGNRWYEFTWKFRERSDAPRWGGCFIARHQNSRKLVKTQTPLAFFKPDRIIEFEMNHRTDPGRSKKIVWYRRDLGYGNDVLGEPVETRNGGHDARIADFLSRFLPSYP